MKRLVFGLFLAYIACAALLAEPLRQVDGFVAKGQLNVRAGAGIKHTLVGKLVKNNKVRIVAANKEWFEIIAPDNCGAWVMEKFIKAGKLTANVNLRSGPGTGYESMGSGRAGDAVKTMGKVTAGGWIMIKPAVAVHYFVSRPAIEADKTEVAKLPTINDKKALPDTDFIALEANFTSAGKPVTLNGTVVAYDSGIKGVTHILYEPKGDELVPTAYLYPADKVKLAPHNDKEARLSGTSYTVRDWDLPLVVVKSVKGK